MPATKKRPKSRTRAKSKADQLAKELKAVKAEVAHLQEKCMRMNLTLAHLIYPKEWFTEEVDDDELWAKAIWKPSLEEIIDNLK